MSSFVRKLCAVIAAFAIVSCGSGGVELTKPHRVARQDLAGSTYITVLSIAPWDDYVDLLQPKFTLTAEDALTKSIATTRGEDERFLKSVSAALKLATPTSTEATEIVTGAGDANKNKVTKTEGPGDISKATFDNVDDTELPDGTDAISKTTLEKEPILQHMVATALFQEVQLLSRYVKDAAVRRNMVPYVIRMQVTVMPDARNEPYDAYSNISFFYGAPVPVRKAKADENVNVAAEYAKANAESCFRSGARRWRLSPPQN